MKQERPAEWNSDELSRLVHDKSWAGDLWGPTGAIAYAEARFEQQMNSAQTDRERAGAHTSLSSTYYTARGNADAHLRKSEGDERERWSERSQTYLKKALHHSNEVERLVGVEGMTPDQLDVRATILHSAGRTGEALGLVDEALARSEVTPESHALLLTRKARIHDERGRHSEAAALLIQAREEAKKVRGQTQVRIEKAWGRHLEAVGDKEGAGEAYDVALAQAEHMGGMDDQVAKISALKKRLTLSVLLFAFSSAVAKCLVWMA